MKKRQFIYCSICLFAGSIITFAILVVLFTISSKSGKVLPLVTPRAFGNIKIWVEKVPDFNDMVGSDVSKIMFISKEGKTFLAVYQDKTGKIDQLTIIDQEGWPLFSMRSSDELGKWERAAYSGYNQLGQTQGEFFLDFDFDGHFDIKFFLNDKGTRTSTSIYVDSNWKQIDHGSHKKATSGQETYVFVQGSGWQLEK